MDNLIFKYATMNSGKTMDLIIRAYNYKETNNKIIVMKPKIDTKGENTIVSRTGLIRDVDILIDKDDSIINILEHKLTDIKAILIDEAQFLSKSQVDELQIIAHTLNIDIICYGLRNDFLMNSFEGSKRLLEIADILEEQASLCKCGDKARFVGRKVNGEFVLDGDVVVIDGTENVEYVPMCATCYLKDVKKIDLGKIKKKVR